MSYQTETNWMDELVSASTGVLHDFVIDIIVQGVPSELRLGFVDLDFKCSTVCPTLLGLMGICHKRLGSWARWWNTEIKVNSNPGFSSLGTLCTNRKNIYQTS